MKIRKRIYTYIQTSMFFCVLYIVCRIRYELEYLIYIYIYRKINLRVCFCFKFSIRKKKCKVIEYRIYVLYWKKNESKNLEKKKNKVFF